MLMRTSVFTAGSQLVFILHLAFPDVHAKRSIDNSPLRSSYTVRLLPIDNISTHISTHRVLRRNTHIGTQA
jgi:hypothetical protein